MGKEIKRKKILIQIVCVLLSFGLWVYINATENPIGQKIIKNVPVEIVNTSALTSDGLAIAPGQNLMVSLNIKGPSEKIFNSTASDYKVILQLDNTQLTAGSNWLTAQVVSSPNGITVTNQLIKVNLKLEPIIKKEFPVQSALTINTASGIYVNNTTLSPSTVTVEGASSAVDSVSKIIAVQTVNDLSKDTDIAANLVALNAKGQKVTDVNIYPGTVNANITVNNGKVVPVNVVTEGNLPKGVTLKSITPTIQTVEVLGDSSAIANISSINTEPIDLSKINSNETVNLNLVVPQSVKILNNVNNVKVEVAVTTENSNSENNGGSNNNSGNGSSTTPQKPPTETNEVEKTFTAPIEITGEQSGYKYSLSNTTTSITLKGTAEALNGINPNSLLPAINVSQIKGSETVKLTANLPTGVSLVSQSENEVIITATKNSERVVTTNKEESTSNNKE